MIPPGIYVMKELDALVDEMSGKLDGFSGLKCEGILPRGTAGSERIVTVRILARKDGWCRLELSGDEDGTAAVMEFLTGLQSLKKVLVWDSSIDAQEYSYSLFQEGKLLEQFSVKGPALEVASFVSELRKVQLQDLIQGRDFAQEALRSFGLWQDPSAEIEDRQARLDFSLPPRRTFWRSLLGSLSGGG